MLTAIDERVIPDSHVDVLGHIIVAAVEPKQNVQLLGQFVEDQAESASLSTPPVVGVTGHIMDASSDYFTTVMGFLDKFVKIGGEISKVSVFQFRTAFCFSFVFVGTSVCETGLGCDHGSTEGAPGVPHRRWLTIDFLITDAEGSTRSG